MKDLFVSYGKTDLNVKENLVFDDKYNLLDELNK